MTTQATLDFSTPVNYSYRLQNSKENQRTLEENLPKLNNQCRVLLQAFQRGLILTVADGIKGIWDYQEDRFVKMGDLRARVRDLIKAGYNIGFRKLPGGYKEYFLIKSN